ncbi:6591_t:CDS:1, partial [Diversispora eburnea]
ITLTDPSNIDKISSGIGCYNLPFLNVLDISHVNSPPSNSLSPIYSSQNSPDSTNSNPPVDQYPLEITFLEPSNMDQISPGIDYCNSPFTNVLGPYYVNSPPSDSLSIIHSSWNSPNAATSNPLMVKNPLEITSSMDQISSDNTCYNSSTDQNSLPLYAYQNVTYSDYPLLNIDKTQPITSLYAHVTIYDDELMNDLSH